MKITSVELLVLKSDGLYNSPESAEEPLGPAYLGIVRVTTDEGITGYSDVETCAPVAKACIDAPKWSEGEGMECFDGLASLLVGENPLEVERLWYRMYRGSIYYGRRGVALQAISAIDIALWDIAGKALRQPVSVLLGARWRHRVRAYASTLFRASPEAMRQAASVYLEQGFTAVKFGWGVFGRDPGMDVRLVEAARGALGMERDLLVDTGWFIERTPKQAIQVVRSIEHCKPYLIEELLHPEDYAGYRRVAETVDTPIACGEQEATEWGFARLIEESRIDVVQPDLSRCGGFTTARKIAHMADRANTLVIPHAWSSDLLTAASLHYCAFLRRAPLVEFSTSRGPLSRDLCAEPLRLVDGHLGVPAGPGLGVTVDERVLEKYRVA